VLLDEQHAEAVARQQIRTDHPSDPRADHDRVVLL
jgi:hypothetical protein